MTAVTDQRDCAKNWNADWRNTLPGTAPVRPPAARRLAASITSWLVPGAKQTHGIGRISWNGELDPPPPPIAKPKSTSETGVVAARCSHEAFGFQTWLPLRPRTGPLCPARFTPFEAIVVCSQLGAEFDEAHTPMYDSKLSKAASRLAICAASRAAGSGSVVSLTRPDSFGLSESA